MIPMIPMIPIIPIIPMIPIIPVILIIPIFLKNTSGLMDFPVTYKMWWNSFSETVFLKVQFPYWRILTKHLRKAYPSKLQYKMKWFKLHEIQDKLGFRI